MNLRLGALCLFENPSDEAGRALIRQFVLVRDASLPSAAGPRPLLTRYACPADTREEALAIARPYLEARVAAGDVEAVLAQSLVGSHAEVADRIRQLGAELGLYGVVVVPMSAQFDTAKRILAWMVDEVRPLLDD